jgi:hypothetical protein
VPEVGGAGPGGGLALPAGEAGGFAPVGELLIVDAGGRIVCHLCGRAFAFLPGHLPRHGWSAELYREVFGLGRSTSLCAPALQQRRRELGVERYAANPQLREGLAVRQALARNGELLKLSHAAQPVGNARAQSRQRAGERTEPTRTRTAQLAAKRLQCRLVELGFAWDLPGYLTDAYERRRLPVLAIARELKIGNVKIQRLLDDAGVVRRRPGGAETARGRCRDRK